jgi:hypothetical protein
LYGDPLWRRTEPSILDGTVDTFEGLLRRGNIVNILKVIGFDQPDPYKNNFPQVQGPGGNLAGRWQSRCLKGDAYCGEGFGSKALVDQIGAAVCHSDLVPSIPLCEHQRYPVNPGAGNPVPTAVCGNPLLEGLQSTGYGLTRCGAKFLALKTFPDDFTKDFTYPEIAHYETAVELGELVYLRLYYTDPSINGFGFVGIKGSGWAEENFPFSSPSYGRVSSGRIDYPFNHLCGTPSPYESDVEAWMDSCTTSGNNCTPISPPGVPIHMTCNAPKEMITPFFNNEPVKG